MAYKVGPFSRWLAARTRLWLVVVGSVALVSFLGMAAEASNAGEADIGLLVAVLILGFVPWWGLKSVRPVTKHSALERLSGVAAFLFGGLPALLGVAIFAFFLGSVIPGGQGWEMDLGAGFLETSVLLAMVPLLLTAPAKYFIIRARGGQIETQIALALLLLSAAAGLGTILAAIGQVLQLVQTIAVINDVAGLGLLGLAAFRLASPIVKQAEEALMDDELSEDHIDSPWAALRRV